MPIFEYICIQCCNKFERLLSRSDTRGVSCPECHSEKVTKLFSRFGVASEGSQFSNLILLRMAAVAAVEVLAVAVINFFPKSLKQGGNSLTKSEIIDIVAEGTGLTKLETSAVVDGFMATIGYALKTGDTVTLRGFGSFRTVKRNQRIARNPKTGKIMNIPKRRAPVFKASTDLKKLVNQDYESE